MAEREKASTVLRYCFLAWFISVWASVAELLYTPAEYSRGKSITLL
jgi:hypothetical protein